MLRVFGLFLVPLIFLIINLATSAFAKNWDNPSEKYTGAYKSYTDATCPISDDNTSHFVYFTRDRRRMRGHTFLTSEAFDGAQIMYAWRQLETSEGRYDFSDIRSDLKYLNSHGKRLFIQLQDVSFSAKYKPVPNYLLDNAYDGGVVPAESDGRTIGWIAKRWNPDVRARFAALLQALGDEFDGQIEGINLQESAIDVAQKSDPTFSPSGYAEALKANMQALKTAFPTSTTMQYANFMPGEWLPWEDEGYLRSLYETGEDIGVGLGAPDLMIKRKAQLNHPIAMMHEGEFSVPIGIAVQDGNYVGATGADAHSKRDKQRPAQTGSMVPLLHAFAKDFLKVDYMFWVDQKPYFEQQVLPCFKDVSGTSEK